MTISMGGGSGHLNIGSWWDSGIDADGNVTIDASSFGGTIDTKRINASGAVTVALGESGDFSAGVVSTASSFVLDASASHSGSIHINTVTASNVTIAMGGGSGHLTLGNWWGGGGIDADGNVTIDASSWRKN